MSLQRSNAKSAILWFKICRKQNARRGAGVLFGLPVQAKWLALQGCFAGDGANVCANNAHVGEVAVALMAECSNSRAVLTPVPV
jgi:hypothetical protein